MSAGLYVTHTTYLARVVSRTENLLIVTPNDIRFNGNPLTMIRAPMNDPGYTCEISNSPTEKDRFTEPLQVLHAFNIGNAFKIDYLSLLISIWNILQVLFFITILAQKILCLHYLISSEDDVLFLN